MNAVESSNTMALPDRETGRWFMTTRWSVVTGAGDPGSPAFAAALEALCTGYRPPLLAYLRRMGQGPEDAEDLVQGFFAWLIARNPLPAADPGKGRFRSFLLGMLKNYLSDQHKHRTAQKRGGGMIRERLDTVISDLPEAPSQPATRDLEAEFDREWALNLLRQSVAALRTEYRAGGKADLFEILRDFQLARFSDVSYAEVATRLDLSVGAVKSAIHRLRMRHAQLLREAVARTVTDPAEVDGELRHLVALMTA